MIGGPACAAPVGAVPRGGRKGSADDAAASPLRDGSVSDRLDREPDRPVEPPGAAPAAAAADRRRSPRAAIGTAVMQAVAAMPEPAGTRAVGAVAIASAGGGAIARTVPDA